MFVDFADLEHSQVPVY